MAIAFDAATRTAGGNSGASVTWAHTCTGSDRYLVVAIGSSGDQTTGVTYNGVAMTLLGWSQETDTGYVCELWGLAAPATGANNIVASFAAAVAYSFVSSSYTGVHQTISTGTSVTENTFGGTRTTTPSGAVTAATDDLVVDAVVWNFGDTASTETVGAGQTQRGGAGTGSFARLAFSDEPGATTTTMSWTLSLASYWALCAIALKPAAAAAGSAITFDAASSVSTINTGNNYTFQHTCNGANRALIVACANNSPALVHAAYYAGVPMTNVAHVQEGATGKRISLWKLSNPTSGTNNVALSFSAAVAGCFGAASFNGCQQTTSSLTRTPATGTASTTFATVTTSASAGDMVIGIGVWAENISGVTGAQQTLLWQDAIDTNDLHCRVSRENGSVSVVLSYSLSATSTWAVAAVALIPATSSGEVQAGQTVFANVPFFPRSKFPIIGWGFMCEEGSIVAPSMPFNIAYLDVPMFALPPTPISFSVLPQPADVAAPTPSPGISSESIGPRISLVPNHLANDEQWKRQAAAWMAEANQGHLQNTGLLTLTANADSTTVTDYRAGNNSYIEFMPRTANAATEQRNGTMYISSQGKQTFTITHANNGETDRTFVYSILG